MKRVTSHRFACLVVVAASALAAFGQQTPPVPALPPSSPAPAVPAPTTWNAIPTPWSAAPPGPVAPPPPPARTPTEVLTDDSWVYADSPSSPRLELLPTSLLWEPKLADKREPRLSAVQNDVDSVFSNRTTDPSIGLTAGILRLRPEVFPSVVVQVDLFAVAHLRFSRADESIAQDYRAGVPITWRAGNWVGKFGYEHTSTQLGDELSALRGVQRITFERDETVGALGYLWDNQLRTYGQVGYAFSRNIPGDPERWRYDVGFDWFKRVNTGRTGQPFAAINAAFNPEVNYAATMTYQFGWMWRKDDQRLGQFRVYAEFFDGHSMFGQLFRNRERYAGIGFALDY